MYNILSYFKTHNDDIINDFLDYVPIKHQANGSLVSMKGSNPWMDYSYVTRDEFNELIDYLEHFQHNNVIIITIKIENYTISTLARV
jgi:hypothetical protein